MVDFEVMNKKYPRVMIVLKGLWLIVVSTIVSLILISPIYIFDIDRQILVDIFTSRPVGSILVMANQGKLDLKL